MLSSRVSISSGQSILGIANRVPAKEKAMATLNPDRRDRFLYLGGPVDIARTRARRLALLATLIYAACLFVAVMLAHELMDNTQASAPDAQAPALHSGAHRF
jgi:hypothetical protein